MLFADKGVQTIVNSRFVAAWQSVRPVPIVTIDFGNGHTLRRTLNGNVATYVCDPEGRVIDVIPGLCDPETYVVELAHALTLYEKSRADFSIVADHHREQAAREVPVETPGVAPITVSRLDISKVMVQSPLKAAIRRDREVLAEDGRRNLRWRKPLVHGILSRPEIYTDGPAAKTLDARRGVRPADITKAIYRLALHVELDDPYVGLEGGPFSGGAYGGFDLNALRRGSNPPR